jgi:hypothetical protein
MKITIVQIFVDHAHDICPPALVLSQFFKMTLSTIVICASFGMARLVNIKIICCWLGHG